MFVNFEAISSRKRILLCGDFFYPSVGGSELYLEEIALRLLNQGYAVDIACRWQADRETENYNGIRIHQFRCAGNLGIGFSGTDFDAYRKLVYESGYDTVFVLTHPDNWNCVALVPPPQSRPRLVFMPSINATNVADWERQGNRAAVEDILRIPDLVISATESGFDSKFLAQLGRKCSYIPHAVFPNPDNNDFRVRYGIKSDTPLLLLVANFWPVKNQLGLLKIMTSALGEWQLVLIGHKVNYPKEIEYFKEVERVVATDARIRIIDGLPHGETLAAIRDADLLLLASLGESAGPLVVLEAMSFGTPWIATPECNAVHDEAGGVVVPLVRFPETVLKMLKNCTLMESLGELGRKHWQQFFTWEKVFPAYLAAIRGDSSELPDFSMPVELRRENFLLQQTILNSSYSTELGVLLSVIIPTFNRSDILKQCLVHLCAQSLSVKLFEVIVCDDGSSDGTAELVNAFKAPFSLIYLRQENSGPASARNMGIVRATGEYMLFLNDDALLDPRALEIHLEEHRRLANPKAAVLGLFRMHPEFTDTTRPVGYCLDNTDLIFEYCSMQPGTMYGYEKFYTCNISLRKDFIIHEELFDPKFVCLAGGEDIEYGYRLQLSGAGISYRPDCIAFHAHSITPSSLGRMFVTRGKGGVIHFLRHNNLAHHYEHMRPVDAEQFRKNHARLEPLVIKMGELLQEINKREYLRTAPSPLTLLEKNLNLGFMFLWKSTGQRLEENILALLTHLENLSTHLSANPYPSLEETALQIFPVLNFIKWYYDTVGIAESADLDKLMELDRVAGLHGVESQQGASYLTAPVVPDYPQSQQQVSARHALPYPVWSAPNCLLDLIPFPFGCADGVGLSEKFGFFQKNFQLRIQEGNLITSRYMGIVNGIFDTSQGQAPPELLGMGYYTLLRILEEKPYLEDVAEYASQLSRSVKGPDPGLGAILGWIERYRPIREEKSRILDLLANFEYEQADPQLAALAERNPGDPELLLEQATRLIATRGDWDQFLRQRESVFAGTPFEWWWHWTMGASLFRTGAYEAALKPLAVSLDLRANSHTANLLAECLYRLEEREGAMEFWKESLRYDPLQMHLYLKMHDCQSGFDRMVQHDLSGENICVLLYCWNKRDILEATLNQLAKSNLGNASILMLDNNSTDGTGELMERAAAMFPRNKCRVISLPTNIGAPAARNWLMAQPEARQSDYIAYLDDDVDVPADWLGRLVATLKAFPKAGVVGSRIVDPLSLPTLQYCGVFLDVAEENSLRVTCKHGNETDCGQMDYVRSCVSVMGCCHLFRNAALYDVGEFDVRFSPTQVDDIEHDIRTVLKGYEVIYNGHNRVVHHQKTGKQSILNRAAKGNVDANVHKMITKHSVEETRRIKRETEERDRQAFREKIAELRRSELLEGVREVPYGII